jgi:cell division septum initiation protein DivIVA
MSETTPTPMTDGRLAEIRAREQAATPGHWGTYYDGNGNYVVESRPRITREGTVSDGVVAQLVGEPGGGETYSNARFIAHAREDVPALLDELDRVRTERDELQAELGGRDEEARERWIQKQLAETSIRAMDFRNGMAMEIEPARDTVAQWVGAARAMLGDAPNYSETPIEMEVKVGESPERYVFILQRVAFGALTPHQARQKAEAERDALHQRVAAVEALVEESETENAAAIYTPALRAALNGSVPTQSAADPGKTDGAS